MPRTEVAIVGAGPGGYVAAIRAAQLGKKVTVIDDQWLGGVCLNVGCIPSKALIHVAKLKKQMGEAKALGLDAGDVKLDMAQVQKWKGEVVAKLVGGIGQLHKAHGVAFLKGRAKLTGPHTLEVATSEGPQTLEADHIILATGSRPVQIPGFEVDGKRVLSSTEALDLQEVPGSLCVIGGGYIGLELGTAYAHLGSKVTVVEMMDQLLPGTDKDLVRVVARRLKAMGVEVHLQAKAQGLTGAGVKVQTSDGKTIEVPGEKVLLAVGRKPNTQDLGLDRAGVKVNDKGLVETDDQLRTNVPHIFAIGDITTGLQLAHKASHEGVVAAEVIAGHKAGRDWTTIPAVVFTDPEIAYCGLSEAQAKEQGVEVTVARFPFAAIGRAVTMADTDGMVKLVVDKPSGVVLGVGIVGPDASDLISEAALAVEMGATVEDLALTVHPHPTLPEAIMEAAHLALGAPIHVAKR